MVINPAYTKGTWRLEEAEIIKYPMPAFEALISEMTAPTKASVTATFRLAKKYGALRGKPTLKNTSALEAPNARSTSCNSGSTVANPVATLTAIGKKLIKKAVRMAGGEPIPNQITKIGTSAAFGTLLKPTRNG